MQRINRNGSCNYNIPTIRRKSSKLTVFYLIHWEKTLNQSIFPWLIYVVFSPFFKVDSFSLKQLKKIYIHRVFTESMPFPAFCYTICRNLFQSWDHLQSNLGSLAVLESFASQDNFRACTVLGGINAVLKPIKTQPR